MAAPDSSALETLLIERARLLRGLLSQNTHTGYRYDWLQWERWCATMHRQPLPADSETASLYATAMLASGKKVSTCTRRLSAIAHTHRANGHPSPITPEVRELLRGARRLRAEPVRQVLPLTVEDVKGIAELLTSDGTPIALRDRCIVVVGFCSVLRESSLVALRLEDVEFCEQGAILRIRREKQDQEGKGRLVGLPHGKHPHTCPVTCLREWIAVRGSFAGPLFTRFSQRSRIDTHLDPGMVCLVVQACVRRLGLDWRRYGGHSLRAGCITECGEAGAGDLLIASQSGHRDMQTLRKYFRRRDVFRSNPLLLLDL